MEFLIYYSIFSLTTALASSIILMKPVMADLKAGDPLNSVVQSPVLAYLTFTIMALLLSPVMFLACIWPDKTFKFQEALASSLKGS